jgi:hypothetical protein
MPKTGTTALQNWLYFNREGLGQAGILYPDMGRIQHFSLVDYLSRSIGSPAVFPQTDYQFDQTELEELLNRAVDGYDSLLLSSEFFFDYPALIPKENLSNRDGGLPYLKKVATQLAATFQNHDVKIITWIRRQDNWLISMYNNVVKQHMFADNFEEFMRFSVAQHCVEIIEFWADVFGQDNVIVKDYEMLFVNGSDVIDQYCQTVGIDRHNFQELATDQKVSNPSISTTSQELKRQVNLDISARQPGPHRRVRRVMSERLIYEFDATLKNNGEAWPYPIISPGQRREILDRFGHRNLSFGERFGIDSNSPFVDWSDLDTTEYSPWHGVPQAIQERFDTCMKQELKSIERRERWRYYLPFLR